MPKPAPVPSIAAAFIEGDGTRLGSTEEEGGHPGEFVAVHPSPDGHHELCDGPIGLTEVDQPSDPDRAATTTNPR